VAFVSLKDVAAAFCFFLSPASVPGFEKVASLDQTALAFHFNVGVNDNTREKQIVSYQGTSAPGHHGVHGEDEFGRQRCERQD
jgi:hypothetical protein